MPQPKQERFLRSNADIAIFGGAAFLLNIDTPIPTTEGWKVLSDIVNGDRVFDECGVPCTVVEAHPPIVPNIAYRLVFDDGSRIEAGSEHLWLTYDAKELESRNDGTVRTTQEIIDTFLTPSGYHNHYVWLCDTIHSQYPLLPRRRSRWMAITYYERIEPMMMRCLTVDSPSHLYLAGKTAIPTHNSGKTFALLMECARYSEYGNFGAVIFRREAKQVNNEGGLRDTALKLYAGLAEYRSQPQSHFIFTSGYRLSLSHLNVESDVISWHGSQIGLLCFDELTTFTAYQFWYMLSRNRSTAGIKPRTLATCNPDPDSWVAEFIDWWIDPETGFPIQERSGTIRYLLRCQNRAGVFGLNWASSRDDLLQSLGFGKPSPAAIQSANDRMQRAIASGQSPLDGSEEMTYIMERQAIKSVTFVPGNIYDNPIGMMADPGYIANLKAQDPVNRARLLDGNWKIRASAGAYFPDHAARIVETRPDVVCWVRSWDLAATEPSETETDPDYTVGLLLGRCRDGGVVVADMVRMRKGASFIREMVLATARRDGTNTLIYIPQDPGQAGKYQITTYREWLAGYTVVSKTVTANKEAMAEPVAALWQSSLIALVRGAWNDALIKELDLFPTGRYDDCVDALTGGIRVLPQITPDYSSGFNRR